MSADAAREAPEDILLELARQTCLMCGEDGAPERDDDGRWWHPDIDRDDISADEECEASAVHEALHRLAAAALAAPVPATMLTSDSGCYHEASALCSGANHRPVAPVPADGAGDTEKLAPYGLTPAKLEQLRAGALRDVMERDQVAADFGRDGGHAT